MYNEGIHPVKVKKEHSPLGTIVGGLFDYFNEPLVKDSGVNWDRIPNEARLRGFFSAEDGIGNVHIEEFINNSTTDIARAVGADRQDIEHIKAVCNLVSQVKINKIKPTSLGDASRQLSVPDAELDFQGVPKKMASIGAVIFGVETALAVGEDIIQSLKENLRKKKDAPQTPRRYWETRRAACLQGEIQKEGIASMDFAIMGIEEPEVLARLIVRSDRPGIQDVDCARAVRKRFENLYYAFEEPTAVPVRTITEARTFPNEFHAAQERSRAVHMDAAIIEHAFAGDVSFTDDVARIVTAYKLSYQDALEIVVFRRILRRDGIDAFDLKIIAGMRANALAFALNVTPEQANHFITSAWLFSRVGGEYDSIGGIRKNQKTEVMKKLVAAQKGNIMEAILDFRKRCL